MNTRLEEVLALVGYENELELRRRLALITAIGHFAVGNGDPGLAAACDHEVNSLLAAIDDVAES